MQRDLDLVRAILFSIESSPNGCAVQMPVVDGYTEEQVGYHAHIMGQAGLISAIDITTMESLSPCAMPTSLTWEGHDFLDSIKDDTLWKKAKEVVIKPVAGVAFDVLVQWAKLEAKKRLGIP